MKSLKRVSSSLMTFQKLYASNFMRYEKQEVEMFNQIMSLKMIEQDYTKKNLDLNIEVANSKQMLRNFVTQTMFRNLSWLKRRNSRL